VVGGYVTSQSVFVVQRKLRSQLLRMRLEQ
jgi:hypothetical protein